MIFRNAYLILFSTFSLFLNAQEPIIKFLSIEGADQDKYKTISLSVEYSATQDYDLILHQGQILYDPTNYHTQSLVIACLDSNFIVQQNIKKFNIGTSDNKNTKKWYITLKGKSNIQVKLECYCFEPGFDLPYKNQKLNFKFLEGNLSSREEVATNANCTITQSKYHEKNIGGILIKEYNNKVFSENQPLKKYTKERFAQMYENAIINGLYANFTNLEQKKPTIGCPFFKGSDNKYDEAMLDKYFKKEVDGSYVLIPTQISICIGQKECVESAIIMKNIRYKKNDMVSGIYYIEFLADIWTSNDNISRLLQK